MSLSFSAEQYDQEFTPKRLGMYEIPKDTLSKTPKNYIGSTKFIANERGYLLDGAQRADSNPFGDFLGTWDLPKTIPGPIVKINPTARSKKNLNILELKRSEKEKEIKEALNAQKPIKLRKNHENLHSNEHQVVSYPHKHETTSHSNDNIFYNPVE